MEHRAPSGKVRRRGEGDERTSSRSSHHTSGVGSSSSSSHHAVLAAERGEETTQHGTTLHALGASCRHQIRQPPSRRRHRDAEPLVLLERWTLAHKPSFSTSMGNGHCLLLRHRLLQHRCRVTVNFSHELSFFGKTEG
jgi:hypothetical protein